MTAPTPLYVGDHFDDDDVANCYARADRMIRDGEAPE